MLIPSMIVKPTMFVCRILWIIQHYTLYHSYVPMEPSLTKNFLTAIGGKLIIYELSNKVPIWAL